MNVNLTPRLEAFVREKVEGGLYNNASEVVREALRQMHESENLKIWSKEEIEKELLKAVESGYSEGPIDVEDIKKRGRERLAQLKAKNAA